MGKKIDVSELENNLSHLLKQQSKYPKVNLKGQLIHHKTFGKGFIIEVKENILVVKFDETTRNIDKSVCLNNNLIAFENNILTNAVYLDEEIETVRKKITELKKNSFYPNILTDSKLMNIEKANNDRDETLSKLDEDQKKVYEALTYTNSNYFITGEAGTGKSYILNLFRKTTNKKILVLAPTGLAARNVDGVTIHSAFGYNNLVKSIESLSSESIELPKEKAKVLKNIDTIIIDEISMVRADIFEKMDKILKIINNNDRMFGGKQIIAVGDLFQLPPVVKENIEKEYLVNTFGGVYFFNSNAYKYGVFKFIELTTNHRQKNDAEFHEILKRIRTGNFTQYDIEILNSKRLLTDDTYDRYIAIVPTRRIANEINTEHISKLDPPEHLYKAKVVLENNAEQSWESKFPINETLILRKGANVMMTCNDPDKHWENGTMGIVNELDADSITVAINGNPYKVKPTTFKQKKAIYKNDHIEYIDDLVVEQYPILPAYAITTHKSQGQTYKNVLCDVEGSFAAGQVYVALSRCTSLRDLRLRNNITEKDVLVDKDIIEFYSQQNNIIKQNNN